MAVSQKANRDFVNRLKTAPTTQKVEVEVIAPAYRDIIQAYYPGVGKWDFESGTDGFFSVTEAITYSMYLLLEAKDNLDLREVGDRAKIVIQCLYYMHRFKAAGHAQPTVVFGGDRDQMFVIYAPPLLKYLDEAHDWGLAPSTAWHANPTLLESLKQDPLLATFVYDINDKGFSINDVFKAMNSLADNAGTLERVKIIPQNIRVVYDEFLRVMSIGDKVKIDPRDAVHFFIASLLGDREVWVDPKFRNQIHLGKSIVKADTIAYEAFFSRYERNYSASEVRDINAMYDVLFEETSRRFSGDYWTPTIWTDRAHELLTEELGAGWRQRYAVWDAACGTKNLTRDYDDFGELYLSTIYQTELDTSTQYNPHAVAFQYDFLNDDVDVHPQMLLEEPVKMPTALYRALVQKKPIVFLMNPPYGTATNDDKTSKSGIANSHMNKIMIDDGLKTSAQQLYAQFFYRVVKLKRDFDLPSVVIAFFSNERFMCGGETWEAFMTDLQRDFGYRRGVFFNAGEFADVSAVWGISFTIWRSDRQPDPADEFPLSVEETTGSGIHQIQKRVARNIPQALFLSTWAKEQVARSRAYQVNGTYVRLSNAFSPNLNPSGERGSLLEGAVGYAHNNANDVEHSPKEVGLYSTAFGAGNGFSVLPINFDRACANFMIRKSVPASWVIGHENFARPSDELQAAAGWAEFVSDAIVFSLANPSGSNQSALRQVDYKGTMLDVENQWFYMSQEEVATLAAQHGFAEVELDLKRHPGERFVYQQIQQRSLSREATVLLDVLRDLVRDTFPHREDAYYDDPDRGYQAWDAGFWQLYLLAQKWHLPVMEAHRAALETLRGKAEERVRGWGLL